MKLKSEDAYEKFFNKKLNKKCGDCVDRMKKRILLSTFLLYFFAVMLCVIIFILFVTGNFIASGVFLIGSIFFGREVDETIENMRKEVE